MILIDSDPGYESKIEPTTLERAARSTMDYAQVEPGDLVIRITTTERLHELNLTYRAVDKPTDVLAFADGEVDPDTGDVYLGSVEIALPIAESQAKAAGNATMEELQLLVVHGVLHLLGYDHYDEEEKTAMWAAQDAILTSLGVSARPTEE